VPIVTATIERNEVPSAIVQAVNTRFDKNNPLTWSKFPYQLKDYGWVYDFGSSDDPIQYEVTMKTSNGHDLWASYDANGNLVETREMSMDIPVPRYIQEAIYDSPYKDWRIIGDKEIVRFYQGGKNLSAKQDFRLTVENGKAKKKLGFKYEADKGKYQAYVVR
jgi:hypothetical protein